METRAAIDTTLRQFRRCY